MPIVHSRLAAVVRSGRHGTLDTGCTRGLIWPDACHNAPGRARAPKLAQFRLLRTAIRSLVTAACIHVRSKQSCTARMARTVRTVSTPSAPGTVETNTNLGKPCQRDSGRKLRIRTRVQLRNSICRSHFTYYSWLRHARIVEVCRAIKLLEHIPTTFSQHWNMCALTGVNTNHALVIDRAEHNPLFIDASFASFATMLWLLAHIDAVEYNRTMEFVNQTPTDQSIRTTIAAYQQHLHAHSEHLTNLYFHAASYTLQCIHTTTLHIESQKLSPNST